MCGGEERTISPIIHSIADFFQINTVGRDTVLCAVSMSVLNSSDDKPLRLKKQMAT